MLGFPEEFRDGLSFAWPFHPSNPCWLLHRLKSSSQLEGQLRPASVALRWSLAHGAEGDAASISAFSAERRIVKRRPPW